MIAAKGKRKRTRGIADLGRRRLTDAAAHRRPLAALLLAHRPRRAGMHATLTVG